MLQYVEISRNIWCATQAPYVPQNARARGATHEKGDMTVGLDRYPRYS
jgi:hypothetical protein